MQRLGKALGSIEDVLASLALAVVLLSVVWGILSRILPVQTAVWSVELSGIIFTWAVFIGAAAAYRRGQHVSIPIVTDLLPDKVQKVISLIVNLAVLLFLLYAVYLSVKLMIESSTRPSPVLRIPFTFVYLPVALSCLSMASTTIKIGFREFKNLASGTEA